ncbi:glutamate 5-kinase [Angomonas deanei]|uniref:Amino acid kinase family, putative n=1 Tax=Angomonas deanei TaxID=59799 RepID=S9WZS3_9TRYP|nr:glutamate 5-kinase [Angomonas deanei]EPY41600.1 glutamate 5-kinase [Angomonas deanei]CAD2213405.1 Amino acid kinase family, putative [Angomonas deanei]|eukprot:EPY38223.1 glutamate 5-kinase [Angomonas deanei]
MSTDARPAGKKRVVIKVGSSSLVENEQLVLARIEALCKLIADLLSKYEVVLVSSGAVAAGYTEVKLDKTCSPAHKQTLASVGQPLLMHTYHEIFEKYDICCAQLLLGFHDFDSRTRTQHAVDAVNVLLANGVVPIVNENDATATPDWVFGDNDRMAAHVSHFFDADLLVILSDIDGYYDSNPRENPDAKVLKFVDHIPESALSEVASPNNAFATGGIVTKLKAADFLMKRNRKMFLTSGFDLSLIREYLLEGKHNNGTLFLPKSK